MRAIVFDRFGDPGEVLEVREVPRPEPGRGQVRVRMLASPVNPAELLTVRGTYGRRPPLPATPGFEGVGVVEAAGPGLLRHLRRLVPGRRVVVLNGQSGNWQEEVVVPATQLVPVAGDLPDEQAATFFVNPATALAMVRRVLAVPRGAWLLQTAAGSALGRMLIRLGKHDGFRTLNVVRRREQAEELLRAGADAVVCTADEMLEERVQAITGGRGVPFAVDAVGGATGSAVLRSLGPRGRMLVYGTLSEEPLEVNPRTLMAGQKSVEGFWLSEWARAQGKVTMLGLLRQISGLLRAGVLTSEVGATFPLEQVREAVREAAAPGRKGKVLLRLGPER
jgi:NADPH:quinone reductase-like Zn-dependent oxidoreductase